VNDSEERVLRLELTTTVHDERINSLESRVGILHTELSKLVDLTSKIRWWLAGIGTFYITREIGILPFLKSLVAF